MVVEINLKEYHFTKFGEKIRMWQQFSLCLLPIFYLDIFLVNFIWCQISKNINSHKNIQEKYTYKFRQVLQLTTIF